jgi:hypothetical protein
MLQFMNITNQIYDLGKQKTEAFTRITKGVVIIYNPYLPSNYSTVNPRKSGYS